MKHKKTIKSCGSLREQYTQCIRRQGIPASRARWYLSWVEQFARSSNVPLEMRSPEDVEQFLRKFSQRPNLQEWQYVQAIDALCILYLVLLPAPWSKKWLWNQNLMTQSRFDSKGEQEGLHDDNDVKAQISYDLA